MDEPDNPESRYTQSLNFSEFPLTLEAVLLLRLFLRDTVTGNVNVYTVLML